jgi:type IX secretion system PorP/SprF family membrane protein
MKNLILLNILFVSLLSIKVQAQETTISNFYTQNKFSFNPARTGEKDHLAAYVTSRSQWVGLSGAPRAIQLGIHSPINKNTSLGLSLYNDKRGFFNTTFTDLSYSYKINLSENQQMAFGVTAGLLNKKFTTANVETGNYSDPVLMNNNYNKTIYRTSVGIYYTFKKRLELDVVAPHLLEEGDYKSQITALASYSFNFSDNVWKVRPSVLFQNFPAMPNQADFNVLGMYKDMLWMQVGCRTNKSFLYSLGYRSQKGIELAYSYSMDTGVLATMSGGVHEFMVAAILFPKIKHISFGNN